MKLCFSMHFAVGATVENEPAFLGPNEYKPWPESSFLFYFHDIIFHTFLVFFDVILQTFFAATFWQCSGKNARRPLEASR